MNPPRQPPDYEEELDDKPLSPIENRQHRVMWMDRQYLVRKKEDASKQLKIYLTWLGGAGTLAALVHVLKQMWPK